VKIVAYIDGGARGNPGPAAYGVRIERPDGTLVEEFHGAIGIATNNVAEYRGLLAALEWAKSHDCDEVLVRSDSQLLVQQMLGHYKVKHAGLQPLHAKARLMMLDIGRVSFEHVGRALNAHADRLANEAMDEAVQKGSKTARPQTSPVIATDPVSPLERAVRLFVYEHLMRTATAPDVVAIAGGVKASVDAVGMALKRLADLHALVLAPASANIWMAHPFSAVPTAYPVDARGKTYWANCAWDAVGILSLTGDGECRPRCADCGAEIAMTVRDGRLQGEGVVHYAVPPRHFWDNVAYT
jgi:ribonuclease HI